jgi:hypothetical protein
MKHISIVTMKAHTQSTSKQVNSCSSASDLIWERSCSNLDWNIEYAD